MEDLHGIGGAVPPKDPIDWHGGGDDDGGSSVLSEQLGVLFGRVVKEMDALVPRVMELAREGKFEDFNALMEVLKRYELIQRIMMELMGVLGQVKQALGEENGGKAMDSRNLQTKGATGGEGKGSGAQEITLPPALTKMLALLDSDLRTTGTAAEVSLPESLQVEDVKAKLAGVKEAVAEKMAANKEAATFTDITRSLKEFEKMVDMILAARAGGQAVTRKKGSQEAERFTKIKKVDLAGAKAGVPIQVEKVEGEERLRNALEQLQGKVGELSQVLEETELLKVRKVDVGSGKGVAKEGPNPEADIDENKVLQMAVRHREHDPVPIDKSKERKRRKGEDEKPGDKPEDEGEDTDKLIPRVDGPTKIP